MATRIIRQLIDDMDGSNITDGNGERLQFAIRNVAYRIDLSAANVAKFEKALEPFVEAAAEVVDEQQKAVGVDVRRSSTEDVATIRAWARKKGLQVSAHGRIRREVIEAFDAAH